MNSVFKVGAQFLKFGLFIFNTMGHEKRKNLIFLVIHLSFFLAVVCFRCFVQAFLQLQRVGATLHCGAWASFVWDTGFSSYGAWA